MEAKKRAEGVHRSPHTGQPEYWNADEERNGAGVLDDKEEDWHTLSTRNEMEGCKGERNGKRLQVVLQWQ